LAPASLLLRFVDGLLLLLHGFSHGFLLIRHCNHDSLVYAHMESYMQINANETRDAIAAVEKLDDWFKDKLEAQEALTPIDTPAFTADGVRARMKPITVSCNSYIRLHVRSHGEGCIFIPACRSC
jgi:hypothetical protein